MTINCFVLIKHLGTKTRCVLTCWITLKSWKQGKHYNNFKFFSLFKSFFNSFRNHFGYFIFIWHKELIFDINKFFGFGNAMQVSIINWMLRFFNPCAPFAWASAKLQPHIAMVGITHESFNHHLFCHPVWLILN